MHRPRRIRCLPTALALAGACLFAAACGGPLAAAPLISELSQRHDSIVVPTENGTQYVMVESPARTSAGSLRNQWKRKAKGACKGEYMVMSESASVRRRDSMLASRIHEGYVRCVNPEAASMDAPTPS